MASVRDLVAVVAAVAAGVEQRVGGGAAVAHGQQLVAVVVWLRPEEQKSNKFQKFFQCMYVHTYVFRMKNNKYILFLSYIYM
jgi:hypothetical protein